MKIKFTANISPQASRSLTVYKKLLSDMIEDNSLSFNNYEEQEDGTKIITVKKERGSYIIYWEVFSGMYLRHKPGVGLSIGYKFSTEEYIDFFISEKFQNEHSELMEENTALWTNDMKSFPKSHYVTKHKSLLPYIRWAPGNPFLPDYMYLEISFKKAKDKLSTIKNFYNSSHDIRKLIKLIKEF